MTRDVGVVIVAAGDSTRARAPGAGAGSGKPGAGTAELKQFRWIAGKPMLLHSLQTFMARADVTCVVCVLPQSYVADPPPWIFQCDVDRLLLSVGGRTRTESVRNGLEDLPEDATIALVHDAARPLVDAAMIDRVVATARGGDCAVPALPVIDTIKEVDASGRVIRTVERDHLRSAQTPQGFPREVIQRAHREARAGGIDATDDAALCERIGARVVVVPGSERAIKVTSESDFARVEALFTAPR